MVLKKMSAFEAGLLISLAFHLGVFWVLSRHGGGDFNPFWAAPETIEIDLTRPFRLTADPRLARQSPNPGTGAPLVAVPKPGETKPGGGLAAKGTEWTLPGAKTTRIDLPLVDGSAVSKSTVSTGAGGAEGESGGLGGLGTGGEGEVDWVYLTEMPRLLNREEIAKNIRRFYPEAERRAGREGLVVARLHLTREGRVSGLEIERSAGDAFDAAARNVLSLARFSPARAGDRVVAVKIRQTVDFRLRD